MVLYSPVSKKIKFKKGDKVLIVPNKPPDVMRDNFLIDWEPEMDVFLGKETKIASITNLAEDAYTLEIDTHSSYKKFIFAKEWLLPIK